VGTTGYPLTSTNDSTTSPSDSEGQDETTAPPECELRGSICGEMSVCQCDCDFGTECCTCFGAQCTNDTHCEAGESCVDVSDSFVFVALQCVSAICNQNSLAYASISSAEEAGFQEGNNCLGSLSTTTPDLVDLGSFASLEYIHTQLSVTDNAALTTFDGLESLRVATTLEIRDNPMLTNIEALGMLDLAMGGSIRENPMLPTAQIEALLASIGGGDLVEYCGNLDGDPCPE